tara:strand:+ start:264 stop:461 length:198 start_codon:yes stop_codon:yes gene_type:complete
MPPFLKDHKIQQIQFDFKKYVRPIMTTVIKPNIEIPENRQKELDGIFNNSLEGCAPVEENKLIER